MVRQRHILRGMLAGAAAGLAASWVMNEFMTGPGERLRHAAQSEEQNREEEARSGQPEQSATMKAADAIASSTTSGRHLSWEQQKKVGPVVHYTFGALSGAVYGGLAEFTGKVTTGFGTGFGGVLFALADLLAVPALELSGSPKGQPASALVSPFSAHVVYGVATELARRAVRPLL